MDFLDPKKLRRGRIVLGVGYLLIATAIAFATIVLLYQAFGFGFGRNGQIIQNGLVFVSSQPSGANIYIDNELYKSATDTRLVEPAGSYNLRISAPGYRDWQRPITVVGGMVQHFDYPLLFPQKLSPQSLATYASLPGIFSQSPDQHWLLVEHSDVLSNFTLYDLSNPKQPPSTELSLPPQAFTAATGSQNWSVVEWSTDNRHALLLHTFTTNDQPAHEYVLLDRQDPASSVNLTNALSLPAGEKISLFNGNYNRYYSFDKTAGTLRTLSLDGSLEPQQLNHILAFTTSGSKALVYVTDQPPTGRVEPGKVSVIFQLGQKTYTLRTLPASQGNYLLDAGSYNGDWYIAFGVSDGKGVYLFRNPQSQQLSDENDLPSAWRFLSVPSPQYLKFAPSAQFLMVENGQRFAVYDAETIRIYNYTTSSPLATAQPHATWMDGARIMYINSDNQLVVFDYDHQNVQTLQTVVPQFPTVFTSHATYQFSLAPGKTAGSYELQATSLRTS